MGALQYRHEWKIEINASDMIALRQRLRAVAEPDPHAVDGRYSIRSLYFDSLTDRALREKLDGVSRREKFRIRFYNGDTSVIHLEKKSKVGGLGTKQTASLTPAEAQAIADGDLDWMRDSPEALIQELHRKMVTQGLRPRTIVDYDREPFRYPPGNVRVTLDYHIRTGWDVTRFLSPDCLTVPAGDAPMLLEVKWDNWLPATIRDAVQLQGRRSGAFSKYAQCRTYG